jgi:hypothetical protein
MYSIFNAMIVTYSRWHKATRPAGTEVVTNQPTNQSTSQPTNQPTNQPTDPMQQMSFTWSKNYPHFMESESRLPCPHRPTTGPTFFSHFTSPKLCYDDTIILLKVQWQLLTQFCKLDTRLWHNTKGMTAWINSNICNTSQARWMNNFAPTWASLSCMCYFY